ncbi:V-type proton ATPasesubunit a [Dirofilaria immitis]
MSSTSVAIIRHNKAEKQQWRYERKTTDSKKRYELPPPFFQNKSKSICRHSYKRDFTSSINLGGQDLND